MKNSFVVGVVLLAGLARGQTTPADDLKKQIACEAELLRDSNAQEIQSGPEYKIFLDVAAAFKRDNPPRFYFVPGGGNAVYIAGSVAMDAKGKILMSRMFATLMGNTSALTGIMAHEMAHLVTDIHDATRCDSWIIRDPKVEMAADALAASKVGFGPVRAFLLRVEELTGAKDGDIASRLQALEKLEAEKSRQR